MRVLIIAYFFPPDSASGSFRPLFFANHLVQMGVDVHVLTARVEDYLAEQSVDWQLCEQCDVAVAVTRCAVRRPRELLIGLRDRLFGVSAGRAAQWPRPASSGSGATVAVGAWQGFKDLITDLLATPDPQVGWIPDCMRQAKSVIAAKRPDLIFATGSPWSGLLAGMLLKKSTGIPLILDFRDPWTSNPSFKRRSSFLGRIDRRLEEMVVRCSDGIIANTAPLRGDFLRKYPFLPADKVATLTNGFEEYLPQMSRPAGQPLTITHTGALYFSRNPIPLLQAVKTLIDAKRIAPEEIRLQFIGGIEDPDGLVAELLENQALRQVVKVVPRLPYHECQRYAMEADLLLLVQPDFPLQVPRKVYEYMAIGKPMLCIAESESATGKLVAEYGLGTVTGNSVLELVLALQQLHGAWRQGQLQLCSEERCARFTNREITRELYRFFGAVLNSVR